jgi:protease-4
MAHLPENPHSLQNFFKVTGLITLAITAGVAWIIWAQQFIQKEETVSQTKRNGDCNVQGISLLGVVTTYEHAVLDEDGNEFVTTTSDYIQRAIREAQRNKTIRAVLVEIDSQGGEPVAGEEIANALTDIKKPTVALIRGSGTSSAYWVATGADTLYASSNSQVGGIGVTLSYVDQVGKNRQEGFTFNQLSVGKFKDYGNPHKELTQEEEELFLRDVKIIHENFITAVAKNRRMNRKDVSAFADGSTVLGAMAKERGLINDIGGIHEVTEYLEKTIGGKVEICW